MQSRHTDPIKETSLIREWRNAVFSNTHNPKGIQTDAALGNEHPLKCPEVKKEQVLN